MFCIFFITINIQNCMFQLHDNALTNLPPEIGELKILSNLSLDHNKITVLPKEFYKLMELRWLSISHNQLQIIEPDFGDLVMLTFLVSLIKISS